VEVTHFILTIIGGYLLGSVPFGLLLVRYSGMGDIRDIGSGSIGATNVLRTGNKKIAAGTLILDMAKGASAVLIFGALGWGTNAPLLAGLAAFVGHCYPVWLKFDGGKGVATYFGITVAWAWPIALLAGVTWIIVAAITRYSSLAALITVLFVPLYFWLLGYPHIIMISLGLAFLVFWRHKENISRLLSGSESKIGESE
jgi:glycerol-3-phosphate acyltransferase PlsY